MSKKKVLVVDWNGKSIKIQFRKGWKFSKLEDAIKEETKLSLSSDCYLEIGGEIVESSESFDTVMNHQNKDVSDVNAKLIAKSSKESRKIECAYSFMDQSKSAIKMDHEFEEEFDFDTFWDELGRLWKDRDKLFDTIEISREMRNESKENANEPEENPAGAVKLKGIKGRSGFEDEMYEFTDEPKNVMIFFRLKFIGGDGQNYINEEEVKDEERMKRNKERIEKIKHIDNGFMVHNEENDNENKNNLSKINLEKELEWLNIEVKKRVQLSQSLLNKYELEMERGREKEATYIIEGINPSKNTIINICKRLDRLLTLFEFQGFRDTSTSYVFVSEAKEFFDKSMENVNSNTWNDLDELINDKWDVAGSRLEEALKDIQPFNTNKMLKLHQKTSETSTTLKNKDIILCIGHTGAGKSTTIHFLAGSTMKKDRKTGHIYPLNVINDDLKEVKIDYRVTSSVTEYVTAVKIELPVLGGASTSPSDEKTESIYLCDTPGFDDSGGSEIDVANGLGIVKAVTETRSARLLLIIGVGDCEKRFEGIKNLSHTLSSVFPNFNKSFNCISIFFTKFSKTANQIQQDFRKGCREREKENEKDEAFMQLMKHISKMKQIIKLNPVKDNQQERLHILASSEKITPTKGEFKEFVSDRSLDRIIAQTDKHKDIIRNNLKNYNYDVIFGKLKELKELNQVIKMNKIKFVLEDCCNQVRCKWNESMQEMIEMIQELESNSNISENVKKYLNTIKLHETNDRQRLATEFLQSEKLPLEPVDKLYQMLEKQFDLMLSTCSKATLKMSETEAGQEFEAAPVATSFSQAATLTRVLKEEEFVEYDKFENKLNKEIHEY